MGRIIDCLIDISIPLNLRLVFNYDNPALKTSQFNQEHLSWTWVSRISFSQNTIYSL